MENPFAEGRRHPGKDGGFTLVELLTVIAIMAVLITIALVSFQGMGGQRYIVEKQTKEIYADLMNARLRALQRDRSQFVVFANSPSATMYSIYEDGPAPNGDGVFTGATDSLVSTYTLKPAYNFILSNPSVTLMTFSPKGMLDSSQTATIRIDPTAGGEYDCICVDQIKTSMGRWNGTQCVAD